MTVTKLNQPIRLPGLKPGVCSGLILSGAKPRFKNRGLAPSNVSIRLKLMENFLTQHYQGLAGNQTQNQGIREFCFIS